jgi:hypothetical protein
MQMKLDDIELIKRGDKDGEVNDIRSIYALSVYGNRRIVELPIPGSVSNVFQDMGRNPIIISFEGELAGTNATSVLESLNSKFELKKPLPFSTDITPISSITEVIINNFAVHFMSGVRLGVRYSMVLKEHASASIGGKRGPGETPPPNQEEESKKEIQQRTKNIYEETNSGRR